MASRNTFSSLETPVASTAEPRFRYGFGVIWLAGLLLAPSAPVCAATLEQHSWHGSAYSTCDIDLSKDRLEAFWKDADGLVYGHYWRVEQALARRGETLACATNGGIFDETRRPLGLFVHNGIVERTLNVRDHAYGNFYLQPNGVLVVRAHGAEIVDTKTAAAWPKEAFAEVSFAIQSGPLLIYRDHVNDAFVEDSHNRVVRNAACLVSPTHLVLVFAADAVNFWDFAVALRTQLRCTDALFLDGHISSMYPGDDADSGVPYGVIVGVVQRQ